MVKLDLRNSLFSISLRYVALSYRRLILIVVGERSLELR